MEYAENVMETRRNFTEIGHRKCAEAQLGPMTACQLRSFEPSARYVSATWFRICAGSICSLLRRLTASSVLHVDA